MPFHYHFLPSYETPLLEDDDISSVASNQVKPPHYSIAMSDAKNVTTPNTVNTIAHNASNKAQSIKDWRDGHPIFLQLLAAACLIVGFTIGIFKITQVLLDSIPMMPSWLAIVVSSLPKASPPASPRQARLRLIGRQWRRTLLIVPG
jgi:hypothetical protein